MTRAVAVDESPSRSRRPRRPRGGRRFVLAGVEPSVLAAVTVVALGSGEQPSTAATIEEAATFTGEITRVPAEVEAFGGRLPAPVAAFS